MKTSIRLLRVTTPKDPHDPSDDRKRIVLIATPNGDLMMNRLRRLLRVQEETAALDEDERFKVDMPDQLIFQIVESYIRKSKAIRRKDRVLDRKETECEAWYSIASLLFEAMYKLHDSAEAFENAVLNAENGGDQLLSEVSGSLDELNSALKETGGLIEELDAEYEEEEE